MCNREIKFGDFLKKAKQLEADLIATGHYAQIKDENGTKYLVRGADSNKDQTYFLYAVPKQQLMQAIFPIRSMQKKEVRALAEKAGLRRPPKRKTAPASVLSANAISVNSSVSICRHNQAKFARSTAREIGKHHGMMYYTLGQRQGLGIGGSGTGEPWFVAKKDLRTIFCMWSKGMTMKRSTPTVFGNRRQLAGRRKFAGPSV